MLPNETVLRLEQHTTIHFSSGEEPQSSWLELLLGTFHAISRVPRTLKIDTPFVNAAVEGTEFMVRVDSEATTLWVFEGQVAARNRAGQILLAQGEVAARENLQQAVALAPQKALAWARLAELQLAEGDLEQALRGVFRFTAFDRA